MTISLPPGLPPVIAVSSDGDCSVELSGDNLDVSPAGAPSCRIWIALANGATLATIVQFLNLGERCGYGVAIDASAFEYVDGGAN